MPLRRGPMPGPLRTVILGLFALVFLLPAVQMCAGVALVGGTSAAVFAEYVPTDEDQRTASELSARAADKGLDVDVTAQEIAFARRLGKLDEVEAMTDRRLDRLPTRSVRHRAEPGPVEEITLQPPPSEASLAPTWLLWAVAVVTLLASVGLAAAAVLTLSRSRDEDDPAPSR